MRVRVRLVRQGEAQGEAGEVRVGTYLALWDRAEHELLVRLRVGHESDRVRQQPHGRVALGSQPEGMPLPPGGGAGGAVAVCHAATRAGV